MWKTILNRFAVPAFLLVFSSGIATATVVTGQVTQPGGGGIPNVDLDFIDTNTGLSIPLVDDKTDILGFYAINIQNGEYDIQFEPPAGIRFVAEEVQSVSVQGATLFLDQVLEPGWLVSGRIVDDQGIPLAAVDLDFIEAGGGGEIFTANDSTDLAGNFLVAVPGGVLDIELEPPPGTDLVPQLIPGQAVSADLPLGDLTLPPGFHLTGEVQDTDNQFLPDVKVLTLDPMTGWTIFNIRNRTDSLGLFDLIVSPGDYSLRFEPAQGTPALPRFVAGVSVEADRTIPIVQLEPGVLLSGRVTDTLSNRIRGVDLDMIDVLSKNKQFTPNDNTDSNGNYEVTVRSGTYEVIFDPPVESGLAPARISGVLLESDQNLPDLELPPGLIVSGLIHDLLSNPVPGADLDFRESASGIEIATPGDNTDASGSFAAVVPAGIYDIDFDPPEGSGSGSVTLTGVVVNANLPLGSITLPASAPAFPAGISPAEGSAGGGTPVTVTGSGFEPGIKVRVGGMTLSGIIRINSGTIQGTTRTRRAATVDVEVINPGAVPAILPGAFTYTLPAANPVLTVITAGPLGNDIQLQWTDTGQGHYSVFRSVLPDRFTDSDRIDVIGGTSFTDQGAAAESGIFYYFVQ